MPQESNERRSRPASPSGSSSAPRPSSGSGSSAGSPSGSASKPGSRPSSGNRSSGNNTGSRPRRRRRRYRMNPLVYITLVLLVSSLLAGLAWIWAGDMLALNKPAASAVVTLPADIFTTREVQSEVTQNGETEIVTKTISVPDLNYVADVLHENGLVEYKFLFKLFCAVTGVEKKGKIQPGTYELNTDMDYRALISAMGATGSRVEVEVTIPEGYTLDQIFALLEEKGVSTVETLQNVAANYDYKFDFLQGVRPLGDYHRLEGYLFPDTYKFYMGGGESAAVWVLNKMLVRFDDLFTDEMRALAEEMGYSMHEILTIASLIEKETDGTDQIKISSVIHNRMNHPDYETAGYLQIDAAIAYATGRAVTQSDYQEVDSPYNTYLYKGLPPGPIASPGMVSLYSALHPENTNYYYYVLGSDDLHHYFRTHQEQLNYIAQMQAAS